MAMTHGSLFSGIGGFDLAAEWMGWENKFHCEWNEFGQKVLHYYWPEAELFTDIIKSNFTKYANKIDILTGGFPCQPYSSAGKRLGKEDSRHLWPEMLRAIREIQPRWVVGENVRGLTNWNGGLVFDEVQSDLEAEGYEVLPFLLPACAVNAPHRRDRIWFVAYSKIIGQSSTKGIDSREKYKQNNRNGIRNTFSTNGNFRYATDTESKRTWEQSQENRGWKDRRFDNNGKISDVTNTSNKGCQQCGIPRQISKEKRISNGERSKFGISFETMGNGSKSKWQNFPTVSPICDGDDGLSDRLDNITFSKWRNESIKAGGNAVVPQVVYQIFKAIEQYELILQNA